MYEGTQDIYMVHGFSSPSSFSSLHRCICRMMLGINIWKEGRAEGAESQHLVRFSWHSGGMWEGMVGRAPIIIFINRIHIFWEGSETVSKKGLIPVLSS